MMYILQIKKQASEAVCKVPPIMQLLRVAKD